MFISSSGMPQLVKCKISGRYVPISPSYDPNEFVHFYNKTSHKKIMIFIKNRCAQVMTNLIAPFMEELIQEKPARGCPRHLRKSMKITCLTCFFREKKPVKFVIFIDFLRWLGPPLPGWPCMSFCIKGGYPNVRNFWCFFPFRKRTQRMQRIFN